MEILGREGAIGTLKAEKQGLYTVLSGEITAPPGMYRLWAVGIGRKMSLGIMEPKTEGAVFSKKFSSMELGHLPENPRFYAFQTGQEPQIKKPDTAQKSRRRKDEIIQHWERLPDGTLIGRYGKFRYLALPAKLQKTMPGLRLITLGQEEYLLFRY